ncbi:IclR family transcriptional regulator [Rhodococcus sp. D-1]|uniref:IclR family transcriptional regulator n=1 Tax=Rhodococcus sp. D-1 TaxID=1912238 RepID=UPI00356197E7
MKRIGDGRYALGDRLGELGGLVRLPGSFGDLAQCHAADLFARFKTVVGVSVLEEAQVRCIARVSGTSYGHVGWMNTGGRMPIHCTASGKAIMAFSSRELFTQVTSQPLEALTPATIIAPRELALQMQGIRRNGYSLVRDEVCTGSTSIGVPIVDHLRRTVAAFEMELPLKGASIPEVERLLKIHAARFGADLSSRMLQGRQTMVPHRSIHATVAIG